jgi:hypothetical protein
MPPTVTNMEQSMKRLTIAMSMALSLLATPAVGQWLNYKTPGIPRTRDVKPNLTAPAPRAADGKPDLSGMWAIGGLGFSPTDQAGLEACTTRPHPRRQTTRRHTRDIAAGPRLR